MRTETLKVTGMTCSGCVQALTKALKAVNGVRDAAVSLAAKEATVSFDEGLATLEDIRTAVRRAGYDTGPVDAKSPARSGCCGG